MTDKLFSIFLSFFFFFNVVLSAAPSPERLSLLYDKLSPTSISEHLAFAELYQEYEEGEKALQQAWKLFSRKETPLPTPLSLNSFTHFIALLASTNLDSSSPLSEEEWQIVDDLSAHFPNRKLRGYGIDSQKELLMLPPEEVDLAHGLFLTLFDEKKEAFRHYEAMLNLMALQIECRLSTSATAEEKIETINSFIFQELRFRFPPESLYAKNIDFYTFLPSVLQSRQGVCLGISTLYLCLAQRLDLPLEMITPPGHIYLRHKNDEGKIINIETTARGIHLPSKRYLGINTRSLQQRNIKEVIGLNFFNQASTYWHQKEHKKAIAAYQKAAPFLPTDPLIEEFLAYNYLANGEESKGKELLKKSLQTTPEELVCKNKIAEDYLSGKVDFEGINIIFQHVDVSKKSILDKQSKLEKSLKKHPFFREGLFQLAISWMQLNRYGEAIEILERYHQLDPTNPTVEYYLAALYKERFHFPKAWKHLKIAREIVASKQHHPEVLKALQQELRYLSPVVSHISKLF